MEIRARIGLEIAKFKANALVIAAQFKAMGTSAERYNNNVDHYSKRSLDRTKKLNVERVQDVSKTGNAILAKEKQIADDRYSIVMQGAKRSQKDRSKLELDAVRPGSSGEVTGSVRAPARANPLYAKEKDASKIITAQMRKDSDAAFEAKEKAAAKLAKAEAAANAKRVADGQKATDAMRRQHETAAKAAARAAANLTATMAKEAKKSSQLEWFNSKAFESRLASTRYALYDLGQRGAAAGASIAGGIALAVGEAAKFESAFTSVERTTGASLNPAAKGFENTSKQANVLRDALLDMATTIPVAFADLSAIATLGAQLGIATDDLDEFTETVAKFSAITGVSVDTVGLSFGRLAELLNVNPAQFENLSSAVVFAGVNAVATDAEILKMSESIAAASTQAGIAAADTLGFATALASLKVRPEEARGVLTRLFREFDISVSQGGERLSDFARVLGKTTEDTAKIWETDPSQFVQSFLRGAKATGTLNETITALGITNTRELNVITRLANNMDVLESAIADTNEQFALGTFASEAYGLVADDLTSKLTMMQNAISEAGASFGEQFLPFIKLLVDTIKGLAEGFSDLPAGIKFFLSLIAAVSAAAALLFSGLAFGIAGLLALKLAFKNLASDGISAGISISTFRNLLISMIPAATGARTATQALGMQAKATGTAFLGAAAAATTFQRALGVISIALAVIGTAWMAVDAVANSMADAKKEAEELAQANFDAAGGLQAFIDASEKGLSGKSTIYGDLAVAVSELTEEQKEEKKAAIDAAVARTSLTKHTEDGSAAYNKAKNAQDAFNASAREGKDAIEASTISLTEDTKAVYANALAKITAAGEDEPINIWDTIANLPPGVEERLAKSGTTAVQLLNDAMEASMSGDMTAVEYLSGEFAKIAQEDPFGTAFDNDWGRFANDIFPAAEAIDGLNNSAKNAAASDEIMSKFLGNTADGMDELEGEALDLNSVLRETISALTAPQLAENKVAKALDEFAASAKETNGELDGMGEAADRNLSNFASFMDAATEAAILAGEGTAGAARRIIGGLNALGAQGIDTSDAFRIAKVAIVNSVSETVGADQKLKDQLNATTNLDGIRQAIRAFYALKIAAATTGEDVRNFRKGLDAALSTLDGTDYTITPKADTTKAKTALEKLQESIDKAFKSININVDVQNSLNALGKSLRDNGKSFSQFTEGGRGNIESLQGVIDSLAEKSGGNLKKFANDLASLRQALLAKGVSGQGLALIDTALRAIKTRGTAAKNSVVSFGNALGDLKKKKATLSEIADAVGKISSEIKKAFDSNFAYADSIDNITLGWEAMADSSKAAVEEIEALKEEALDLSDAIDEARQSIDEANASIATLAAERSKIEYQLQIAIKYGDTLRATDLQARLQEIDSEAADKRREVADANKEIADSQKRINDIGTEVSAPETATEIINRNKALRDMASRYADMTSYMMVNAEEGADLNNIVNQQVAAFEKNAVAMGFTATQASAVATVLRDSLLTQVDAAKAARIDLGITINTDDATTAVDTFVEDANTKLKTVKPYNLTANTKTAIDKVTAAVKTINAKLADINDRTVVVTTVHQSTGGSALGVIRRASGGLVTGPGTATSDSIAARLSNGEYVVKTAAVKHYGVDFMNALNNMSLQNANMGGASISVAGSQTVYLSTEDRQLLRAAMDRPIALYTDNATIAKSANDGNSILAQRGTR